MYTKQCLYIPGYTGSPCVYWTVLEYTWIYWIYPPCVYCKVFIYTWIYKIYPLCILQSIYIYLDIQDLPLCIVYSIYIYLDIQDLPPVYSVQYLYIPGYIGSTPCVYCKVFIYTWINMVYHPLYSLQYLHIPGYIGSTPLCILQSIYIYLDI